MVPPVSWPAGVGAPLATKLPISRNWVQADLFSPENVLNWVARTPAGHDIARGQPNCILSPFELGARWFRAAVGGSNHLIDRTVSRAEPRRGPDRLLHEIVGALDRVAERQAFSEATGDGGRQRAAGAMRVSCVDTLGDVGARSGVIREKEIGDRVAAAVTALDQHGPWTPRKQHRAGAQQVIAG